MWVVSLKRRTISLVTLVVLRVVVQACRTLTWRATVPSSHWLGSCRKATRLVLANVHDRVMMRLELLGSLGNKASNWPSVTSQKGHHGRRTMLTATTAATEEGRMGQ